MSDLPRPAPDETSEPADDLAVLRMLLDHAEEAIELADPVAMPGVHVALVNLLSRLHFEIKKATQLRR